LWGAIGEVRLKKWLAVLAIFVTSVLAKLVLAGPVHSFLNATLPLEVAIVGGDTGDDLTGVTRTRLENTLYLKTPLPQVVKDGKLFDQLKWCSGSWIGRCVLTAAHCLQKATGATSVFAGKEPRTEMETQPDLLGRGTRKGVANTEIEILRLDIDPAPGKSWSRNILAKEPIDEVELQRSSTIVQLFGLGSNKENETGYGIRRWGNALLEYYVNHKGVRQFMTRAFPAYIREADSGGSAFIGDFLHGVSTHPAWNKNDPKWRGSTHASVPHAWNKIVTQLDRLNCETKFTADSPRQVLEDELVAFAVGHFREKQGVAQAFSELSQLERQFFKKLLVSRFSDRLATLSFDIVPQSFSRSEGLRLTLVGRGEKPQSFSVTIRTGRNDSVDIENWTQTKRSINDRHRDF
jgi:hypothetical protein